MGKNLMDWLLEMQNPQVSKSEFGELVHSDDPDDIERALRALEDNGGYDNLPD
jgi:hypothetical protein